MNIESFAISTMGLTRYNNEDVWAALPEWKFYVLADGLGGHQAGEVAAQEAVGELCDEVRRLFSCRAVPPFNVKIRALRQGIRRANTSVRRLALRHSELLGMGTTLCCILFCEEEVIYAHVGDSRIYRYRKTLKQLTRDHTLLTKSPPRQGKKSSSGFKYVISRALGMSELIEPDIDVVTPEKGDLYLLCSDGLSDYVPDKKMEMILKSPSTLPEISHHLHTTATSQGSGDDITLIVLKVV